MSKSLQKYSHQDYELLDREACYEGFFSLERFRFRHRRFDGSWSREVKREIFVRGNATCVLPYDADRGEVLLIEQFRAGALLEEQLNSPWLLELVAGINDKDETPETIARREAQEEAGIELLDMESICDYFPSPGGATEWVYLRCARADLSGAGGVHGLYEEDEDIKVHVLPLEDAYAMIEQGALVNAPVIMALQWLMLNRSRIDQKWKQGLSSGGQDAQA